MAIGFRGYRDDDEYEDDGPMFGGGERYEQHQDRKRRAREIASGISSGMFERDEEVWAMVRKIKEQE